MSLGHTVHLHGYLVQLHPAAPGCWSSQKALLGSGAVSLAGTGWHALASLPLLLAKHLHDLVAYPCRKHSRLVCLPWAQSILSLSSRIGGGGRGRAEGMTQPLATESS